MNRGLVVPGSWGIGVPLRDEQGQVLGALSIAAVESRMDEERQFQLAKLLSREAKRCSRRPIPGAARRGHVRRPPSPSPDPPCGRTGAPLEETAMSKRAVIVGWSHIPFGKLEDPDTESLMARVSGAALDHAGIAPEDVDGIYAGVMNSGFQKQDFQGALVALAQRRWRRCRPQGWRTHARRARRRCTRRWISSRRGGGASRWSSAPRK